MSDVLRRPEPAENSTARIQAHYVSSGFNPTRVIKSGVLRRASDLGQIRERAIRLRILITAPALLAAVYYLFRGWNDHQEHHAGLVITIVVMSLVSFVAVIGSQVWRGQIHKGRAELKPMRVVIVLVILGALVILAFNFFSFDAQLGVSALALAATSLIIDTAKSKRGRSAIAFRKRLASARQYFSDELQRSNPPSTIDGSPG